MVLPVRVIRRACEPGKREYGWGGWTRTNACQNQNLMPYQLGDTPKNVAILSYCVLTCLPAISLVGSISANTEWLTAFATKPLMFLSGPCASDGN